MFFEGFTLAVIPVPGDDAVGIEGADRPLVRPVVVARTVLGLTCTG